MNPHLTLSAVQGIEGATLAIRAHGRAVVASWEAGGWTLRPGRLAPIHTPDIFDAIAVCNLWLLRGEYLHSREDREARRCAIGEILHSGGGENLHTWSAGPWERRGREWARGAV